jgi:primosomal protein N' (replication factor Y)
VFADVLVNLPVKGTYTYHIPPDLVGRLLPGHLVRVPFGEQKAQGVILKVDEAPPTFETRPIARLIAPDPVVTDTQLALIKWLSETTLATPGDCLQQLLPPGLSKRSDVLVELAVDPDTVKPTTDTEKRILKMLRERGPLRGRQLARALPQRAWQRAVRDLVERGVVTRTPILAPPSARPKTTRFVVLVLAPEAVEATVPDLGKGEAGARRAAVLRALAEKGKPVEAPWVYAATGANSGDLKRLEKLGCIRIVEREVWRDPLAGRTFVPDEPPALTHDQAAAWETIRAALDSPTPLPILLHGVTGSGKTELYLRAVAHVLAQGRRAVILVPEIALTPQTVNRFAARFPAHPMALIHSRLSDGERYDTWRRAQAGQIDLVIGARSALFLPMEPLGLVVLDECHDDSYKQAPPVTPPYYHALPAAVELARLQGALVIMGSATPNVVTYANAERGDYTLLKLPARVMGHRKAIEAQMVHYRVAQTRYSHAAEDPDEAVMIELPPVRIVDMRQELRAGNRSIFSRALMAAIKETLDSNQQAILFLNRRGTATYVFCRECGYVVLCPRCEIPLTWHADQERLLCHHCNYQTDSPETCPKCHSPHIRYFGGGTERVESEIRRRFPAARLARWDRDTTGGKDAHDVFLEQFINHEADVLIGTQMIAKGLDLPLVTLVGVVSADTALYLPDYRSDERTFQLLAQVAGRAGRGLLGGRVIIQTYAPEHHAIRAAAQHDYGAFYEREMRHRSELDYPPFGRLARIVCRSPEEETARSRAEQIHRALVGNVDLLTGATPCYFRRVARFYRWQVVVRSMDPAALLRDLPLPPDCVIDIDPVSLL